MKVASLANPLRRLLTVSRARLHVESVSSAKLRGGLQENNFARRVDTTQSTAACDCTAISTSGSLQRRSITHLAGQALPTGTKHARDDQTQQNRRFLAEQPRRNYGFYHGDFTELSMDAAHGIFTIIPFDPPPLPLHTTTAQRNQASANMTNIIAQVQPPALVPKGKEMVVRVTSYHQALAATAKYAKDNYRPVIYTPRYSVLPYRIYETDETDYVPQFTISQIYSRLPDFRPSPNIVLSKNLSLYQARIRAADMLPLWKRPRASTEGQRAAAGCLHRFEARLADSNFYVPFNLAHNVYSERAMMALHAWLAMYMARTRPIVDITSFMEQMVNSLSEWSENKLRFHLDVPPGKRMQYLKDWMENAHAFWLCLDKAVYMLLAGEPDIMYGTLYRFVFLPGQDDNPFGTKRKIYSNTPIDKAHMNLLIKYIYNLLYFYHTCPPSDAVGVLNGFAMTSSVPDPLPESELLGPLTAQEMLRYATPLFNAENGFVYEKLKNQLSGVGPKHAEEYNEPVYLDWTATPTALHHHSQAMERVVNQYFSHFK